MYFLRYLFLISLYSLSPFALSQHIASNSDSENHEVSPALPLTQLTAAELIRSESKGKVLSVDESSVDGQILFRIKVLHQNGKIKTYLLDPVTGHPPH